MSDLMVGYNSGYDIIIKYQRMEEPFDYSKYGGPYCKAELLLPLSLCEIEYNVSKYRNCWFEYESHCDEYFYIVVCLEKYDGTIVRNYLHRMIAYTFHKKEYNQARSYFGDCELVVDHINGDTLNNSPDNLRYIPRCDNYNVASAFSLDCESAVLKTICKENQDKEWLKVKK